MVYDTEYRKQKATDCRERLVAPCHSVRPMVEQRYGSIQAGGQTEKL